MIVSTPQQNEANRRNSQRSTGPKTPEGKARAAKNALTHGLLSRGVLLPDEDPEAFAELGKCLREDLNPVGELERFLVHRITGFVWRLLRLENIEAGIFAWNRADLIMKRVDQKVYQDQRALLKDPGETPQLKAMFESARSVHDFHEGAKETDLATIGEVFIQDARKTNALAKLSRYETSIERSLYKTYHELERHQASRRREHVAVPMGVEIDYSGAAPKAILIMADAEPQAVEETSLERKTPLPN
jgi:hypothetical protein